MGANLSYEPVDLTGKVCLITGANTGIGFSTAKSLARMHCHVFLACRTESRALEAIKKIKDETQSDAVEFIPLDLGSLKSVRDCAHQFKTRGLPLHLLINNAGVMAFPERQLTVDGYEAQFATNHLGHFLLTNLLLDVMTSSAPARIINLSSAFHTRGQLDFDDLQQEKNYGPWLGYFNSKLANILFTIELQRRLDPKQIVVHAVHPGGVATDLSRNLNGVAGWFIRNFQWAARTPDEGAATTIYVATDPSVANVGGKYFADCRQATPSARATNLQDALKLWEISEKLVNFESKDNSTNDNSNTIS